MSVKEYAFILPSSRSTNVKGKWEERADIKRVPAGLFSGRSMLGSAHIEVQDLEILKWLFHIVECGYY